MYFDIFGGDYSRSIVVGIDKPLWGKRTVTYTAHSPERHQVTVEDQAEHSRVTFAIKADNLEVLRDMLQELLDALPSQNDVALVKEITRRDAAVAVATTEAAVAVAEEGA